MSERFYWGEGGEYGPYRAQQDGWPNAGEAMRDYRVRLGMSVEEAAKHYNEALQQLHRKKQRKQDRPIAASWITMMEKGNQVPTDIVRRRLLADLFHIPYVLFGLAPLEQVMLRPKAEPQRQPRSGPTVLHSASVDLTQYEEKAVLLWQLHNTSSAHTSLQDIDTAIQRLEAIVHEARGQLKEHVLTLLGNYFQLGSEIIWQLGAFSRSYLYAERAVQVTTAIGNEHMIASALYRRGYANLGQGLFETADQTGAFKRSHQKIEAAISDFEQALSPAHSQLKGLLCLELSRLYGHLKRSSTDITIALKFIERAENMVGASGIEEGYASLPLQTFNAGRYYLGRAVALTSVGQAEKAISAIDKLEELRDGRSIARNELRRYAWMDIQYAQASVSMKEYYEATRRATNALLVCKDINSAANIAIIHDLYSQLPKPFAKGNHDVAELGSLLADYYRGRKDEQP